MFALLRIFGVLFIVPIALVGFVLASVGFILKMILRLIAMPFLLIGFTFKAVAFLVLTVAATAVMVPLLMAGVFVIGLGVVAAWGALSLITSVFGRKSPALVKL